MRSHDSGELLIRDFILFYGLPFAGIALAIYLQTTDALANVMITSLSVFAALLFNLLLLTLDTKRKQKETTVNNNKLIRLLEETYANIGYATLIALLTICFLIIPYVYPFTDCNKVARIVVWSIIYYLSINFMLTLAMILKRMDVILVNVMNINKTD